MNLRRRRKRKKDQALDAVASVTKLWSELNVGKKASEGVAKAKELRPPTKLKRVLSLKWVKIGGAVAVVGGAGAAVAAEAEPEPAEAEAEPEPAAAEAEPESAAAETEPATAAPEPAGEDAPQAADEPDEEDTGARWRTVNLRSVRSSSDEPASGD